MATHIERDRSLTYEDHEERWEEAGDEAIGDACAPSTDAAFARVIDGLSTKEIGNLGEMLAASYLEDRGYEIIERQYRCPEGEADLIAYDLDEDTVVMVEVKTRRCRSADAAVFPEEAVDERKQRRYRRIASYYAMTHAPIPRIRFDVVAVNLIAGAAAEVEHIYGAFEGGAY